PSRSPIFMFHPIPSNPGSVQPLSRKDPLSVAFGATVKSEDAGEQIFTALFFNYKHVGERKYDSQVLKAQTIEQERQIIFNITPSRDFPAVPVNTCLTITLLVTHLSSWDQSTNQFKGPVDDLASVTWFATIDDDGGALVVNCPTPSTEI